MGWTTTFEAYKLTSKETREYLDKMFNYQTFDYETREANGKCTVIESSMQGTTYFALLEYTDLDNNVTGQYITMVLTGTDQGYLSYKEIGAYQNTLNVPLKILKKFNTKDIRMKEWCEECIKYVTSRNSNRSKLNKLSVGSVIKSKNFRGEEIKLQLRRRPFSNSEYWVCDEEGCYYRKTSILDNGFEVLTEA